MKAGRCASPNPGLTKEQCTAAVEAVEHAIRDGAKWPLKSGEFGRSAQAEAAAVLGISVPSMRNRLAVASEKYGLAPLDIHPTWAKRYLGRVRITYAERMAKRKAREEAAERGELGFGPVLPGFRISETVEITDARGNVRSRSVRQKKTPGDAFRLPDGHRIKGVSALLDPQGRVIQQWAKTRETAEHEAAVLAALGKHFERYTRPPVELPKLSDPDGNLLTLYPIADHHVGLYAWAKETGADYDLEIASKILRTAVGRLTAASPSSGTAVFLFMGDYFHADNALNRTEKSGHALDVDTRYFKVLETGCALAADAIDCALLRHDDIIVRVLPGNHDPQSAIALALYLKAFYREEPRVRVDADPGLFWFFRWGKCFLAATHGHAAKVEDMPGIMASRRAQDWGETEFRYAFGAHLHHRRLGGKAHNGVTWETLPTLAAPDAWAAGQGFAPMREMIAYTYHKLKGRRSCVMENIV